MKTKQSCLQTQKYIECNVRRCCWIHHEDSMNTFSFDGSESKYSSKFFSISNNITLIGIVHEKVAVISACVADG